MKRLPSQHAPLHRVPDLPRLCRASSAAPLLLGLPLLCVLLLGSCKSGVVESGTDTLLVTDGAGDTTSSTTDGGSTPLPSKPGDLCPKGKCAGTMLCMAGICHASCNQPNVNCNDKRSPCTADEACLHASSFEDACFPATGQENGPCGNGVLCPGGMTCITLSGGKQVCLKLCKYGCGSKSCLTTTKGCKVCSPK